MGYFDDVILPNSQPSVVNPSVSKPIGKGDYFSNIIIPNEAGQQKAQKSADINVNINQLKQEAKQANSFSGFLKNTLSSVPSSVDTILPSTYQTLKEFKVDPFGLKANPKKIIDDVGNTVIDSIKKAGDSVANVFTNFGEPKTTASKIGSTTQAIADVGGAVFSPITALFAGANDVPVLKNVVKAITLSFAVAGDLGKGSGEKIVESLPISNTSKEQLKGGISDLLSLVAQLAIGGKMADMSTPKVVKIIDNLKKKYSPQDVSTIVGEATKLAKNKVEEKGIHPDLHKEIQDNIKTKGQDLTYQAMKDELGMTHEDANKHIETSNKISEVDKKITDTTISNHLKSAEQELNSIPKEDIDKLGGINKLFEQNKKDIVMQLESEGFKEVANRISKADISNVTTFKEYSDIIKEDLEPKTIDRPVLDDGTRVTKAANDINEQLVKQGIEQLTPEQQSKYQTGSYKKDLESTKELMNTDFQKAVDVATGKSEVPDNIRYPQVLFNAIEAHAIKTGDVKLQMELAKSPLGKELSEAAGTLGSHGYNDNPNNSPVKLIKQVNEAREASVVKKNGKSIKQQKVEGVEKLKKEARKTSLKRQDWDSFIKSIQC